MPKYADDASEKTALLSIAEADSQSRNLVDNTGTQEYLRMLQSQNSIFSKLNKHWFPNKWENDPSRRSGATIQSSGRIQYANDSPRNFRSIKRRVFLLLTEPDTSILSALFFALLVILITLMNVVMILQTMPEWQYTPTDCRSCGGPISYIFDDDNTVIVEPDSSHIKCECPPTPSLWTVTVLNYLIYFFTVEWTLRVLCYEPPQWERGDSFFSSLGQWLGFLTSTSTILDALAIFPYYIELNVGTNGLMSLRLLRLFRVFQLLRLGQYNTTFQALSTVFLQSTLYMKLLLGILLFGGAFFGSMMYWLEKGDWKYYEPTQSYQFVRTDSLGNEEVSPFSSIPETFWWFIVTTTTVGYGDIVPVTTAGRWVATLAMLMGVLVIAFPVSVFSDLWTKELRKVGAYAALMKEDEDESNKKKDEKKDDTTNGTPAGPTDPFQHLQNADYLQTSYFTRQTAAPRIPQRTFSGGQGPQDLYFNNEYATMLRSDLTELVASVQSIHESQIEIRAILRKYSKKEMMQQ